MKKRHASFPASRQKGVAALALAAILVAIIGMLLVPLGMKTAGSEASRIEGQRDTAAWAREAIDAYVFANGRLPCPAPTPNGLEQCSGSAKGWLPVATLEDFGAPLAALFSRQPVVYMLYMGSEAAGDPNLAVKSDRFWPRNNGNQPAGLTGIPGYPAIINLVDFCQKLQEITPSPGGSRAKVGDALVDSIDRPDRAEVAYLQPPKSINVAYAFAMTQEGKPFSPGAANDDLSRLAMDAPDRAQSQEYSEKVAPMPASELFKRLGCASLMTSLDAIASANAYTAISVATRDGNLVTTDFNLKMGSLFITTDILAVTEAEIDLSMATELAIANAAGIAATAPGLPYTAPQFAMFIAGAAKAAEAGVYVSAVPLVKNAINLVNNTWQELYMTALDAEVKATSVWADPSPLLQAAEQFAN